MVAFVSVLIFGDLHDKQLQKKVEAEGIQYNQKLKQEEQKEKLQNPWENNNWYAIGDSITANNKYQGLVEQGLLLNSVVTDAKPGQSVKTMANNITKEKLKNIDLITVFGGTNDYGGNKPLGTIKDGKTADTFYGYLKNVIETINADKNPNTTVVFFTPLKRGNFQGQPVYPNPNSVGYKLEDYVNAIKEVCQSYSIPVVDLFNLSGIDENNVSKYTLDNLHPNDAGNQLISKVMVEEIDKIKSKN